MKRDTFLQFAEKIRSFGFTVFVSNLANPGVAANYGIFTDDRNIGRFYEDEFNRESVSLTTVHKSGPCGTGFGIMSNVTLERLNLELLKKCFVLAPAWFGPSYNGVNGVEKYVNIEDWKNTFPFSNLYVPYEP